MAFRTMYHSSRPHTLFVIALARPELYERRPGWNAGLRTLSQMSLEPLAPDQMAEMVRGTVPGIQDQAVNAIVARAEGIPLYVTSGYRSRGYQAYLLLMGLAQYGYCADEVLASVLATQSEVDPLREG